MGFEPFILPKRTEKPVDTTSRDDKVASLAKLLYERGLTSSMTDARRLAEGMVEGEKKVMKQSPKPAEQPATHLDIGGTPEAKPSFGLRLPEDFSRFVSQAAALSHEGAPQAQYIPAQQPMHFGRDASQEIAAVPHINPRKQVMFDDAPDLTKMRGYNGPGRQDVEFPTQKTAATSMRMSTGDAGVKVTRVDITPDARIVEEDMVIVEPEKDDTPIAHSPAPPSEPIPQVAREAEPEEEIAEKTLELPKEKPREQRDLAKEHGVDLFNMFKTNK